MRRLLFLFACGAAVMIILSACATPRLDADYGTSYKLAKINQVLNPDAEKNLGPVYGLDGTVVQSIMGKYYDGFAEKKAAPVYSISVGNIGSGQ